MRKFVIIAVSVLLLSSCATTKNLYYWGSAMSGTTTYEKAFYKTTDKQSPQSICEMIAVYEKLVNTPGGLRQVPPPGICAEYGYLLLKPETAQIFRDNAKASQKSLFDTDDYDSLFKEKGKELLLKEIELYPESETFIKPLIQKLSE